MRCSGLAGSVESPHQQRQIARRSLNQQLLVNVGETSHVQTVHASGIELMREVQRAGEAGQSALVSRISIPLRIWNAQHPDRIIPKL